MSHRGHLRALVSLLVTASFLVVAAPSAHAYEWKRTLSSGDSGKDVKALQLRIAGWFPEGSQTRFYLDGAFGAQTKAALVKFKTHYDLDPNGVAGKEVFRVLERLTDRDGSTRHFDWKEFAQNRNPACSARANAYAGTYGGGMVAPSIVKRNVKRLMWRMEAIRAKGGSEPVGINSGFRSVAYNDCIGGARSSQHLYGTAADNRMADTSNHRERKLARRSQISGIGCYRNLSHNHFDVRIENKHNDDAAYWWWPEKDRKGRDLDSSGKPCWGEGRRAPASTSRALTTTDAVLGAIARFIPGAGSWLPTAAEIDAFARAGEPEDLAGAD